MTSGRFLLFPRMAEPCGAVEGRSEGCCEQSGGCHSGLQSEGNAEVMRSCPVLSVMCVT